ncbi:MAG TPA: P27 family phage terminase small subunit [Myxococcaceae bacterium]|nr:P27 family phage terminase small subunit [Myxococcaceae bacterium]
MQGHAVKVEKQGMVRPHPAVAAQQSAWEAVRKFSALSGLSPSDRARLAVVEQPDERDELEAFLSEQG